MNHQLEDWLYEDGFDATASTYDEKISELLKVFGPISNRVEQHRERPNAIKARLKSAVKAAHGALTTAVVAVLTLLLAAGLAYWLASRAVGGNRVGSDSSAVSDGNDLNESRSHESEVAVGFLKMYKIKIDSILNYIASVPFFLFLCDFFGFILGAAYSVLKFPFGSVFRILNSILGRDRRAKWGARKGGRRLGGDVNGR